MTCGKVLADKWEFYVSECKKLEDKAEREGKSKDDIDRLPVFEKMNIVRICCKRHFLGHVDMMDTI